MSTANNPIESEPGEWEIVEASFARMKSEWFSHAVIVLATFTLFSLASAFAPPFLLKLYGLVSPSLRSRAKRRQELTEGLRVMNAQLKEIHMQDQFAAYAKLQRKIKASERELNGTNFDSDKNNIFVKIGIRAFLFIGQSVCISYLFMKSPKNNVLWPDGHITLLQAAYQLPEIIVNILEAIKYIPGWLLVLVWFGICRAVVGRLARLWQKSGQNPMMELMSLLLNSATRDATSQRS